MTDSYKGLNILMVEDNRGDQLLITELLEASVIKIQLLTAAGTISEAVDLLQKEIFDIILLDLSLPDSSGIGTFKTIKKFAGKMPVIILSGLTDIGIAVEAIGLGAQDYHVKGDLDEKLLTKTILYSIERKRKLEGLLENNERYITISKAELDLMQSEEITRQIIRAALDAIICIDVYGKITVWNPQAEEMFGWKQPEILGRTLTETIIPVEYREKHEKVIRHYLATGEGATLNKLIEVTAVNREGHHFPAELTTIPLTENGNQFFCFFIRDITELKKADEAIQLSHQRLKNAELTGKTGYWHWDVKTGKVSWSEGTYHVFGETIGNFKESYEDFISRILPQDKERIQQIIQNVFESKKTASYEFPIETPGGEKKYISTTAEVILDDKGDVISMFGTTHDVTERKKAQEKEVKNNEQQKKLTELNRAVNRVQKPEEIYELTLIALHETIGAEKASVLLFDDNNIMRFVASLNLSDEYKKAADGHSPWTVHEKDAVPIFISDASKEPTLEKLLAVISEEGICALGFIPLIHQQQLLGKFMVYFTSVHHFTEEEVQIIQSIANNVAFAIWKKKSAIALKESEEKYRAFFENSMDGILLTSPGGSVFAANTAACSMFGMTEKEICLAGRSGLLDMADPNLPILLEERQKTGKIKGELAFLRKDGSKFLSEVSSSVFIDATGNEKTSMMIRDITERKRAEATLKSSESSLRQVLSSTADYFYIVDMNCRIILINETAAKDLSIAWGKPVMVGANILDVIPPERRDMIKNNLEQVFAGQKIEYELQSHIDGLPEWLFVNYIPVNDDNGTILGASVVAKDITKRKKAEQELKDSEERYRALVENAPEALVVFDAKDGKFISVSESAVKLFKFSKEELLKKGPVDVSPEYQPGGKLSAESAIEYISAAIAGDKPSFEWTHCDKDGNHIPCEIWLVRLPSENKILIRGSIIDITERKRVQQELQESERFLNKSQAIANIGSYVLDFKTGIWKSSEELDSIFEFTSNDKHSIDGWVSILHPDHKEMMMEYFTEEVIGKKQRFDKEYKIIKKKSRKECWVHGIGDLEFDSGGTLIRMLGVIQDITKRKEVEVLLKKSEEKYRNLIEQASDPILIYSLEGRIIDYNNALMSATGYLKKDIENLKLTDFLFEEELKKKPLYFGQLKKGMPAYDERWAKRKDGSAMPVELNSKMMPDGNIMLIARDTTERKKTEEEILKTNARFHMLSKATSDIVWDWNIPDGSLWWNDNYYSLLGIEKKKELTEIDDWYNRIHPDDLKRIKKEVEAAIHDNSIFQSLEYRFAKADGTYLHFLDRYFIMRNQDGHPYRMIGSMVNMTPIYESQEKITLSEEKFRTIIEQAPDGVFVSGKDTFIIDVNSSGCNMVGYTKEELQKMRYTELIAPGNLRDYPVRIDELNSGKTVLSERKLIRKDGSEIVVEINARLRSDGKYQSFIRDITDRKKAEQELEDSYKAIRKLTDHLQNIREDERTNIAREIHDELGQQLTVLKMDVSWLNKKFTNVDEPVRQKMKGLLNMLDGTVKTVRRISSELRPSLLDDLGLVAAMEWQLNEFEKRSDIKTRFSCPEEEEEFPNNVKTGLFRIFQESLTNVVRHSNAKKLIISLERGVDSFILSIQDDGKGFDKQKVADKKTLGILGMKERALMIGGTYDITSTPGKGTTVMVKVPLNELIIAKQVTEQL